MVRKRFLLFLLSTYPALAQAPGFTKYAAEEQARQTLISPADRDQVIAGVTSRLKEYYVIPDVAAQMIESLHDHQRQGDYDTLVSGPVLADRLTADLQGLSHDKHLRVTYSFSALPAEDAQPTPDEKAAYQGELDGTNCGFQSLAVLPGSIGYLHLVYFGAVEACAETAATAMKFLSHSAALIFDLRQNSGGDPRMVALLTSYLFDKPTHLTDLYNPSQGKTTQYWTNSKTLATHMSTQPVFVLTSRMTFSAGEQFSFDLKNLGRAMLIGERTGGASHPIRNRRINDHFFISVPEYRYIDPHATADWEGVGVTPDIPATPMNALFLAQRFAQTKLSQPSRPQPDHTSAAR